MNSSISSPGRYWHSSRERRAHRRELEIYISLTIPPFSKSYALDKYEGKWLEDMWSDLHDSPDHDFGLFIPILIPWIRVWVLDNRRRRTPIYGPFLLAIFRWLLPDFLYVTVTQNDDGLEGRESTFPIPPNIFVLSQGGKGHIPILLFRGVLNPRNSSRTRHFEFDTVFLGSIDRIRPARARLFNDVNRVFPNTSLVSRRVSNWMEVYARSKTVLCPRGFGRTSYRLGEVLQMGLIPIYIYSDFPWLPYYDSINWSTIGYSAKVDEVVMTLTRVKANLTIERVWRMQQRIRSLYRTHWTPTGILAQIFNLLNVGFGGSDLRCARYSRSRDETASFKSK
jgi:hypothetical protein